MWSASGVEVVSFVHTLTIAADGGGRAEVLAGVAFGLLSDGQAQADEAPGYKEGEDDAKNEEDAEGVGKGGHAEAVGHADDDAVEGFELEGARVYHS